MAECLKRQLLVQHKLVQGDCRSVVQMLAVHRATRICAFEWLGGGSLETALQGDGKRMGGDIGRLQVVQQILSTIIALHKHSVILGDIKVGIFCLLIVQVQLSCMSFTHEV